jgi:hypothetical protein
MKTRIYLVTIHEGTSVLQQRLIRAATRSQAIRWASRSFIDAESPSQDALVKAVAAGLRVEDAGDPETLDLSLEDA